MYATVDNVKDFLKGITITDSTKITTTDVRFWVDSYSKYVDSKVVKAASVPVTDIQGKELCRMVVVRLVAAKVLEVMYAGSGKNAPNSSEKWTEEAKEILNDIVEGKIDIDVSDSTDIVMTGKYDDEGGEREPAFKKEMDF